MVYETYNGEDVRTRLLRAAKLLLGARVDIDFPTPDPFDALWTKPDKGFYLVRVIDCRTAPADETVAWAATDARRTMLDASGWEERLKTSDGAELILILLLADLCNPGRAKLDFEIRTAKMPKPRRTRAWITTEAFAMTPHPDSPVDLFVIFDL